MLGESVSLWASIYSWLTPTVLFVFLNLMIGTIAITSSFAKSNNAQDQSNHQNPNQIQRSPSVLHRLKSINFCAYRSPESATGSEKSPDFNPNLGFHYQMPNENHPPAGSVEQNQPFLSRSPSVLQRIKSFNLYNYISQGENSPYSGADGETLAGKYQKADVTVGTEQKFKGLDYDEDYEGENRDVTVGTERNFKQADFDGEDDGDNSPTLDEIYSKLKGGHVSRTKSDTEPAAGKIPTKLPRKMRKSASTKSPFGHFEEEDIVVVESRRPATVREGNASRVSAAEDGTDNGVDAKADDFINKFKQQLKLQRIDSIARYKEIMKRGSEQ